MREISAAFWSDVRYFAQSQFVTSRTADDSSLLIDLAGGASLLDSRSS